MELAAKLEGELGRKPTITVTQTASDPHVLAWLRGEIQDAPPGDDDGNGRNSGSCRGNMEPFICMDFCPLEPRGGLAQSPKTAVPPAPTVQVASHFATTHAGLRRISISQSKSSDLRLSSVFSVHKHYNSKRFS